jgi:hypothetical protein
VCTSKKVCVCGWKPACGSVACVCVCLQVFLLLRDGKIHFKKNRIASQTKAATGGLDGAKYVKNSRDFFFSNPSSHKKLVPKDRARAFSAALADLRSFSIACTLCALASLSPASLSLQRSLPLSLTPLRGDFACISQNDPPSALSLQPCVVQRPRREPRAHPFSRKARRAIPHDSATLAHESQVTQPKQPKNTSPYKR